MTERQAWARKRNWLIMRLKGACSIFSMENVIFMERAISAEKLEDDLAVDCAKALDRLTEALCKTSRGNNVC